jgi:hypothetical protein
VFFAPDVSADVIGNLLFGIWETDGSVSRGRTGGIVCGFCTSSEQLAHQIHWLLLRYGIWSSVRDHAPTAQRPSIIKGRPVQSKLHVWDVCISGTDNVAGFADALPMWGPRGTKLTTELNSDPGRHRGSQTSHLAPSMTEPVLAYLRGMGVTPQTAAQLVGDIAGDAIGGLRHVLGTRRLRRDRVERLADALASDFLREVLDEELHYARIVRIRPPKRCEVFDIEVDEHHTFVANGVVVANCSAPFKQAEFDIMYGKGISREGSVLDVGVDLGIVKKSGAWFTYEGEQLGQGRENAKQFLTENLELMVEISEKVRQASGIDAVADEDSIDVTVEEAVDVES